MAPIIVATERGGFGGGINFPQVLAMARSNPSSTLFAGLFILVGHLIGSVGSILCGVGIYLTIAYGYAVMAGVVAVYEHQSAPQPLPPPQPAAPAV
jgi:ABC-type transport system involved in multi-copper enzyme maturation permease subunit